MAGKNSEREFLRYYPHEQQFDQATEIGQPGIYRLSNDPDLSHYTMIEDSLSGSLVRTGDLRSIAQNLHSFFAGFPTLPFNGEWNYITLANESVRISGYQIDITPESHSRTRDKNLAGELVVQDVGDLTTDEAKTKLLIGATDRDGLIKLRWRTRVNKMTQQPYAWSTWVLAEGNNRGNLVQSVIDSLNCDVKYCTENGIDALWKAKPNLHESELPYGFTANPPSQDQEQDLTSVDEAGRKVVVYHGHVSGESRTSAYRRHMGEKRRAYELWRTAMAGIRKTSRKWA